MTTLLSTNKLCFSVNGRKILCDINLTLSFKENYIFIGDNGAGKTTLMKILFGMKNPTSGEIKRYFTPGKNSTFIFQDPVFLNRTVKESINYALRRIYTDYNQREKLIIDISEKYSFVNLLDKNVNLLSGGELQLLSLIRSIVLDPDIIFYDEPSNNLDNDNIQLVVNILNDMAEKNKTLLIVSHDSRIIDQIDSIKFKITDCMLENISNE
tara:strand:+ start:606 stop:1238 length:633 start_codon:yes stop_codon:yes gene_type:complete